MIKLSKDLKTIVSGIQDKKGRNVRVIDLDGCGDTICRYIVICEGNTPTQVNAITQSVGEQMRMKLDLRPLAVEGMRNGLWVAMDYADIMVHVFVPECRQYYDIDHLWEDASFTDIANED